MSRPHILFITGKLAEASVRRTLEGFDAPEFDASVEVLGISVAALMTTEFIARRLPTLPAGVTRVVLPGRARGKLEPLAELWGCEVVRGPAEIKDLPEFLGGKAHEHDLSEYRTMIFAEIVDAPDRDVDAILERARYYRRCGADVIDLGCLPETPFKALAPAIRALKDEDFLVSVDSLNPADLALAARSGADYLLSLTAETLHIAQEYPVTPVLLGSPPTDLDSLCRLVELALKREIPFFADAILDPIHFGFARSISRYVALRERFPEVPIMMGTGNLTELTHADTTGMTALLMGLVSELGVDAILTTEVSDHCRSVVRETDRARRIMFAASLEEQPPQHIDGGLTTTHEMKPFPYATSEIEAMAEAVRDPNYRIVVGAEGVHLYNRDVYVCDHDPYAFFPHLEVAGDTGHAFYLGLELARAQIAWQLGKRYQQDEELTWGVLVERDEEDLERFAATRTTLEARRSARAAKKQASSSRLMGTRDEATCSEAENSEAGAPDSPDLPEKTIEDAARDSLSSGSKR